MQEIYWKKLTQSKYVLCYLDADMSRWTVSLKFFVRLHLQLLLLHGLHGKN